MSITFQPDFHQAEIMPDPQKLVWMGNFDCYENKPELKKFLSEKFNIKEEDLDYAFFDFGYQPYEFWRSGLMGSSLKLKDSAPFYKKYVDGECSFILDGIFPNAMDVEVNLSNDSVMNLFMLLGIDFDYVGSIDPIVFSKKIEIKLNDRLTEFTRPYSESQGEGAKMIDLGLSQPRLENQLLSLQKLCDFCIDKGCKVGWG